jgi:hypothetical protein
MDDRVKPGHDVCGWLIVARHKPLGGNTASGPPPPSKPIRRHPVIVVDPHIAIAIPKIEVLVAHQCRRLLELLLGYVDLRSRRATD